MNFLSILEDLTGKTAIYEYNTQKPGDVDITCADISKSANLLRFQPKIDIERGLREYLSWFKPYYGFS